MEEPDNFGFHYPESLVDRACKFLVMTDYHLWGAIDQMILQDPQWWSDVYLWFTLRASQQQPTVPEWAAHAADSDES